MSSDGATTTAGECGRVATFDVGLDQYGLAPLQLEPMAILQWAVAHGAAGVQFSGLDLQWQRRVDAAYLDELRGFAELEGLYVEWGGAGHIPRDMTTWEHVDLFDANRRVVEQAARVGATVVRSCSGGLMRWSDESPPTETLLRDTAKALAAQRQMLRDHGVILAIELHFEFTTYELLRVFEMCEAEPDDWVGIVLDTMNVLTMLEDPVRATERIVPWVVSTHVKDGGLRAVPGGFESFPTAVGDGVIDLAEIIRRLDDRPRRVHLSVEDHGGTFSLPVGDEDFVARFPDLTAVERAELDALAERTAQAERCVPTDRAIWPDVCEARMSRNVTTLKRLVAALGRR